MDKPIVNPPIPYVGPLQSAISPGKFIRILGSATSIAKQFSCNLQCGSNNFDDVAIHISIRLNEAVVVIKSQEYGTWSEEFSYENSQIIRGKPFEILVICEPTVFKIGINGQHLCEYPHKVSYFRASYIKIEGDVSISQITVESQLTAPSLAGQSSNMEAAPPPYPAAVAPCPYPAAAAPSPFVSPQIVSSQAPYPYPLNTGAPAVVYTNQQQPAGPYAYNPLLQQQAANTAALNATPRSYQPAFWSQSYGYGYGGSRKGVFIIFGIYAAVSLAIITIFLVVFFTIFNKAQEDFKGHRGH